MKLKEYLELTGMTAHFFSKLLEMSDRSIYDYLEGKTIPSKKTAKKIQRITKKKVMVDDLIPKYTRNPRKHKHKKKPMPRVRKTIPKIKDIDCIDSE